MDKIDITMTATIRPSILDKTLSSFCANLFKDTDRCNLILNIDNIGEEKPREEVLKVASKYFKNIIVNYSVEPNFSKAVIWAFSQTTEKYVFNLEDDWILLKPINIDLMIECLEKYYSLVSLRLNKDKLESQKSTGDYILSPLNMLSLNPTLFKGDFIRSVYPLMNPNLNPEKQLRKDHKTERGKYIAKWNYGIYTKETSSIVIIDIGRNWIKKTKYFKDGNFINWRLKGENIRSCLSQSR